MSEKWKTYYTEEQLKTLQYIEIENLKVFIDVCRKLNLEYIVYGGTLLGTEKYKGLIPWDDDIDVAMPRESYEKFIVQAENVLPNGWIIQTPYNCDNSPFTYTKLRRAGTKYLEYEYRNMEFESGIYIDIYPIDRIPDDDIERKKQFKVARKWMVLYVLRQAPLYDKEKGSIRGVIRRICKYIIYKLLRILPREYYLKKIDKCCKQYKGRDTKRFAVLNSPNYNNIFTNLYPLREAKFEGISVLVPNEYKSHLKMRYGNYEGLPKEEERYGHVPYILDLGKYAKEH